MKDELPARARFGERAELLALLARIRGQEREELRALLTIADEQRAVRELLQATITADERRAE